MLWKTPCQYAAFEERERGIYILSGLHDWFAWWHNSSAKKKEKQQMPEIFVTKLSHNKLNIPDRTKENVNNWCRKLTVLGEKIIKNPSC